MNRRTAIKAGLVMIGGVWVPKQRGATIIIRGPRVPAAASAWYEPFALGGGNSYSTFGPTSGSYPLLAAKITLPAGNATKLRIGIKYGYATGTCKIGLYDSSKNEVISTSMSIPATHDTPTEVSITSTAVSAADYYVAIASSTDQLSVDFLTGQSSGSSLITYSYGYSDAPLASISDWSAHTQVPQVGVYV